MGGYSVEVASNGGIVVADQTIAPGQKANVADTPVSVGADNMVIGGTTHAFVPQAQQPTASTILAETTKEHTLAVGATATVSGKLTTNTGASAVVFPEATSIAISTAVAAAGQGQSVPKVIISASVQVQTLAPGSVATINGIATTNTESTPLILSQTTSMPIATTFLPLTNPTPTTIYSSSTITKTVAPGEVITGPDGKQTTNTASTATVLSAATLLPIATATLPPPSSNFNNPNNPTPKQQQQRIFEVNGQLVTDTKGVYGISEIPS